MVSNAYRKEFLMDPCCDCQYFCGYCNLPDGVECPELEEEVNSISK